MQEGVDPNFILKAASIFALLEKVHEGCNLQHCKKASDKYPAKRH